MKIKYKKLRPSKEELAGLNAKQRKQLRESYKKASETLVKTIKEGLESFNDPQKGKKLSKEFKDLLLLLNESKDVTVNIKLLSSGELLDGGEIDSEAFKKGNNEITLKLGIPRNSGGTKYEEMAKLAQENLMQTFSHEMGHIYADLFHAKDGRFGFRKRNIDILDTRYARGGRIIGEKILPWLRKVSAGYETTNGKYTTTAKFKSDLGFDFPVPYDNNSPYSRAKQLGKVPLDDYIGWKIWGQKPSSYLKQLENSYRNKNK